MKKWSFLSYFSVVLIVFLLGLFGFTLSVEKFNNSSWLLSAKNANSKSRPIRSRRHINANSQKLHNFSEKHDPEKPVNLAQRALNRHFWTKWKEKFNSYQGVKHEVFVFTFTNRGQTTRQEAAIGELWKGMSGAITETETLNWISYMITNIKSKATQPYIVNTADIDLYIDKIFESISYWNTLKTNLQSYANFKSTAVTINSQVYSLTTLWNRVANDQDNSWFFDGLKPGVAPKPGISHDDVASPLQKLIDNNIDWDTLKNQLDILNNDKLDVFWNAIQPLLSGYSNLAPDAITFNGKSYNIDQLFAQKDHDQSSGSTISDTDVDGSNARSQLQALVNAKMTTLEQMRDALIVANTVLLTNFWKYIQSDFQIYLGTPFSTPITVANKGNFTINRLLGEKHNDFADLSNAAKVQLQPLLNANVVSGEVAIILIIRNTIALNALWRNIQPLLNTYSNLAPDAITFDSQNYNINQLFVQKNHNPHIGSAISSNGSPSARSQLQDLVNAGMTTLSQMQDALTGANNKFLDDKWTELKTEFANYSGLQSDSVRIGSTDYTLTELWTKSTTDDDGSAFTDNALIQLQALVNNQITWNQIKTELDINDNNQKLDTLWTALKTALADYAGHLPTSPIDINSKQYTINLLITSRELETPGRTLNVSIKTQLQALVDSGITDANAVRTALDTYNKNKLDTFWKSIQPHLSTYPNHAPDSITFDGQNYNIDQLFAQKDHDLNSGSTISSDGNPSARFQLQTLVNADMTTLKQMQDALTDANTALLTTLWNTIQDELQTYPGIVFSDQIPVLESGTTTSRGTFTINHLLSEKDDAFADLSDDAKSQLQKLLDKDVANDELGTALTLRNTNALNALWKEIQPLLSSYSNRAPDAITFKGESYNIAQLFAQKDHDQDNGSTISSDGNPSALSQLQALVNAGMTTLEQMRDALITANTALLTNLWGYIQGELQIYLGAVFTSQIAVANKGSFNIDHLLTEKNKDFADLTDDAKTQLQPLLNANVANSELLIALVVRNTIALNALWRNIQSLLNTYPNLAPDSITFNGQNYDIDQLFAQKDHNPNIGSAISSNGSPSARSQLQALVNAGMTTLVQMQTALTDANNKFLDDKWTALKTEFVNYSALQSDSVRIGSTDYILTNLWTQSADSSNPDGSDFTGSARDQLQALVNNKITWDQIKTELDINDNNQNLDTLWTAFKTILVNYPDFHPGDADITIVANQYKLNLLIDNKELNTAGRDLTDAQGKAQLQALVTRGVSITDVRTALDQFNASNNQKLDLLWVAIQPHLSTYPNLAPDAIPFNNQNYNIDQLFIQSVNTADGSNLPTNAKAQLQALVNAGMTTLVQMQNALIDVNNKFLDDKWTALKTEFTNYSGFPSDSVRIDTTDYTLTELWNKTSTDDDGSDFTGSARDQLQALVDNQITWDQIQTELDALNLIKLDTFWAALKTILVNYPAFNPGDTDITIKTKKYRLNLLVTNKRLTTAGRDLTPEQGKDQLQALVSDKLETSDVRTAIGVDNNQKLDLLWAAIQPILNNYPNLVPDLIRFADQNYDINPLFAQKTNLNPGSTLPINAKTQLQNLVNVSMTTDSQMQTALDTVNSALLTILWNTIQDELQAYPGSVFSTKITVLKADGSGSRGDFAINDLLVQKNDNFTDLLDIAIAQLQTLLNAKVGDGELGTALTLRNTNALNNFWGAIQPHLSTYPNLAPDAIPFSNQNYNIDQLFVQKENTADGSNLPTNAKAQLQALVNVWMTTLDQMQTALANANTAFLTNFWATIQDELQAYPGAVFTTQIAVANKGSFAINHLLTEKNKDFVDLTDDVKNQLQLLFNAQVANGEVGTALTLRNTNNLNTFWNTFKTNFDDYSGFNPGDNDFTIENNSYRIHLLLVNKELDIAGSSLTPEQGQTQLQTLVNGGVSVSDVRTALDNANNQKLDALWTVIQPYLNGYSNLAPDAITFNDENYNIDQLFAQKDHDQSSGSTISDTVVDGANARSQLQALVNAGMTLQTQMQTALADVNTALLTSLWATIQDELQAYPGAVFTAQIAVANKGSFAIDHLLTEKNKNFADLSDNAIAQLQLLLNGEVANDEVGTALTLRNTNALNAFWKEIQPHLSTYSNRAPDAITFKGESYNIDQLFAQKDHDQDNGSTISSSGNPSALSQLQALVNAGMTTLEQMRDALITANTTSLTNLWKDLQSELQIYLGNVFTSQIAVANKGSFNIDHLLTEKNKDFADLTDDAKTQLQLLLDAGVVNNELLIALVVRNTTALNALWRNIQPLLNTYSKLEPAAITFNDTSYNIDQLFAQKDHNLNIGSAISSSGNPSALSQLQALVNAGMTTLVQMQDALIDANNKFLDDKWTALKTEFASYSGLQSDSIRIGSTDYTLTELWNKVSTDDAGSAFTDNALIQLQALVDNQITWNQIKTQLDLLDN